MFPADNSRTISTKMQFRHVKMSKSPLTHALCSCTQCPTLNL